MLTSLLEWWYNRNRTCIPDGCGHQEENPLDDKCLICRLPMGVMKPENQAYNLEKWRRVNKYKETHSS